MVIVRLLVSLKKLMLFERFWPAIYSELEEVWTLRKGGDSRWRQQCREFETVRLTLQAMVVQQINCIASKQEKSLKSYRIARGYARTLKVMKIQKHFFQFFEMTFFESVQFTSSFASSFWIHFQSRSYIFVLRFCTMDKTRFKSFFKDANFISIAMTKYAL